MIDPMTPVDQEDPVPADELAEPDEGEVIEVGAWMGEKDEEPSETPDPEW